MESTGLMAMTETTMLARVDKAKFVKDLTPVEKNRLALACITYGFDPIMGELTIFQGNPYVSVDGRYRKAQETGDLMGVEARPATKEERDLWDLNSEDKFFRAVVKKMVHGQVAEFVGWGRVTAQELTPKSSGDSYKPIVTNPMRMAEKRAEVQALRKAFSIPLPAGTLSVENIVEGSYRVVDEDSGEIRELSAPVEVEGNKVKEPAKKKAPPKAEAATEPAPVDTRVADEPEANPPPEEKRDETQVTQGQLDKIIGLFDGDVAAAGKYVNADKDWRVRDLKNLQKWQYDIICDAFERGK